MMIRTRYGSEIEIVKAATMNNGILILRRLSDGRRLQSFPESLKADGGIAEIVAAIRNLQEAK